MSLIERVEVMKVSISPSTMAKVKLLRKRNGVLPNLGDRGEAFHNKESELSLKCKVDPIPATLSKSMDSLARMREHRASKPTLIKIQKLSLTKVERRKTEVDLLMEINNHKTRIHMMLIKFKVNSTL